MNYGNEAITTKQQELFSPASKRKAAIKFSLLKLFVVTVVTLLILAVIAGVGFLRGILDSAPTISSAIAAPETNTTVIFYSDSTVSLRLSAKEDTQYVTYNNISNYVIDAFIASEDPDFFTHNGFNPLSTKGNSTITEKLVDNHYFMEQKATSAVDKFVKNLQERYVVLELESSASKEEILEYYLNSLTLGEGVFGIQSASRYYFGKDVSELTISEAATLAATADEPSTTNPVDHTAANKELRQTILSSMLSEGFITQEQYLEALDDTEALYLRIAQQVNTYAEDSYDSYFTEALIDQLTEDLIAEGYTSYEATTLIYSGGLRIYSTQDKDIQGVLDSNLTDETNFPAVGQGSYYKLSSDWGVSIQTEEGFVFYDVYDLLDYYHDSGFVDSKGYYYHSNNTLIGIGTITLNKADLEAKIDDFIQAMLTQDDGVAYAESNHVIVLEPQTSMVITDPNTGNVLALYGGRGEKSENFSTNRATSLFRSPGTAMSVLASYLPALDSRGYTLASVFDDSYYSYTDDSNISTYDNEASEEYTVENWYDGYEGLTTIRRGIYNSMDILAARCYDAIGANTSNAYLTKLGFSQFDQTSDRTIQTAIGNLTNGVSLLELTSAYAMFDNGGVYNTPRFYTAVYTRDGELLLGSPTDSTTVCTRETAYLITDAMTDTVTKGTGTDCALDIDGLELAGKNGVTGDNTDLWFIGYTPYYAAGIWSGFDETFSQLDTDYHKQLYSTVMSEIHNLKYLTEGEFTQPDGIVSARICTKSGLLAAEGLCDKNEMGDLTATEIFAAGTEPTAYCDCCKEVTICDETGLIANSNCPHTHTAVLLNKQESTQSVIHGGTADSAYAITTMMLRGCQLHVE